MSAGTIPTSIASHAGRRAGGWGGAGGRLPWPFLIGALTAFAALYITGDQSPSILILGAILGASGFISWRLPGGFVVNWLIRIVLFGGIYASFHLPPGRSGGSWYVDPDVMKLAGLLLAAEMTLRVWQPRRAERLAREVFLLTACVMAAATVTYYHQIPIRVLSPIYAATVILSMRSLAAADAPRTARRAGGAKPAAFRASALIVALAIGLASVYIYERFMYQIDDLVLLLGPKTGDASTVGFSTSHQLVASFDPDLSMERVLLIQGKIYEPHLRIIAFDTFADRQWRPMLSTRNFNAIDLPRSGSQPDQFQLQISRLEATANLLPVPLSLTGLTYDDSLQVDSLAVLHDPMDAGGPYDISVVKQPDFQGPICAAPSDDERKRLLEIPKSLDPKVLELAKQVAGAGDARARVVRLEEYLRSQYRYSLNFRPSGDPLNDFILNHRAAHCQYFASALVVMSRAIGVPARYVGGFYAHESYGADETVVRERDSHAWTECWIDGAGWITLDATPAEGLPDEMFADASSLRRWWERVLDFPATLRQWAIEAANHFGRAAMGTAIALLIGVVLYGLVRRRPQAPAALAYAQPDAQLVELARRFEAWLAQRGIVCPPHRTWSECLLQLKDSQSPLRFANLYNTARFGGKTQALSDAIGLMNQIETQQGSASDGFTHGS